jgi:hypothetical protein
MEPEDLTDWGTSAARDAEAWLVVLALGAADAVPDPLELELHAAVRASTGTSIPAAVRHARLRL